MLGLLLKIILIKLLREVTKVEVDYFNLLNCFQIIKNVIVTFSNLKKM